MPNLLADLLKSQQTLDPTAVNNGATSMWGQPSYAQAWGVNGPAIADALKGAWTAVQDPQTWRDAANQWASAMLAGSVAPAAKLPPGMMYIGSVKTGLGEPVAAFMNPSRSDIARMLQATPYLHLRALAEGPNHAIWPAMDATHGQMTEPLGFTKDARLLDYRAREGAPDDNFPQQAGRFSFWAAEH